MDNFVKILWIQEYFNGYPYCGLALYNKDKLWFKKTENNDVMELEYNLIKLSDSDLLNLEENHLNYCKSTNTNIFYDDDFTKNNFSYPSSSFNINPSNPIPLFKFKIYRHNFNTFEINGEILKKIKLSDFKNLNKSHQILH